MPARRSAGLLVYRRATGDGLQVLLGHMGGPYWSHKDGGAWSIPKGEYLDGEPPLDAARREFFEETGHPAPEGETIDLGEARQGNGKLVRIWAVEGDLDATTMISNTFTMEWPPRSGTIREYPEFDRAAWFDLDAAVAMLVKGQVPFVGRLAERLRSRGGASSGG